MSIDMGAIGGVLTGIAATIALVVSLFTYFSTKQEQRYADLDRLYFDVLNVGLVNPKFRNKKFTSNYKDKFKDEDELQKYECYAYIVWNFCETIYDRKNSKLFRTWKPVIITENSIHREWFDNPENHGKFKTPFIEYIKNNFPIETTTHIAPSLQTLQSMNLAEKP